MTSGVRARGVGGSHPATVALLSLAAAGWWLSVDRMRGMDAGPGAPIGALGWFAATWLLMMAAMMLPAIAPLAAGEFFPARMRTVSSRPIVLAAVFVAGYLAVWALVGIAGYLALRAGRAVTGDAFAWRHAGQWLTAGVLAVAAAYQLTGTKRRSLARCRAPLSRPDGEPVTGPGQAAVAGLRTGARCLESSWALMAVLFALGVMSLVWMAVVAAMIAAERLAPVASPGRIVAAGVLAALAVSVAVSPGSVPGLTVPGSPAAGRPMTRMGAMQQPANAMRRPSSLQVRGGL